MNNDNNLLLIIIIAVVLYWIFNLNSSENFQNNKSINKNYSNEHFTKIDNSNKSNNKTSSISDIDLINKLYTKELSNKQTLSLNKDDTIMFDKPPNQNQSLENRTKIYNEMAKPSNVQPMFDMTNNTDQTYQSFDDNSYMLLPSNAPKDPKFDKVTPSEKRKTLTTNDLLPKDENKDWFQVPNSKFNLMQAVDLEVPEIKIGTDTVGQSLKNATYDLRSAPPNPKFVVSPWQNSTIEPDYNTKPLC